MEEIIFKLIGNFVFAVVFLYFLKLLWEKLQIKDDEIQRLNNEMKIMERSNIEAISKLSEAVNSLKEIIVLFINKYK